MADHAVFLVELGTEELPPKDLKRLADSFRAALADGLGERELAHRAVHGYATPRRLAVRVDGLLSRQPDRRVERRGPPVRIAFDTDGRPTRAALAFAESCGVAVEQLAQVTTPKGAWLSYAGTEAGADTRSLLPGVVEQALAALPIAKRMRWGALAAEFVRPVHWLVMLLDDAVVECELFGIAASRDSRGHRFHAPGKIRLERASDYPAAVEASGKVIVDFAARRAAVVSQVQAAAGEVGGEAALEADLVDEVTSLVEWPVAIAGRFAEKYLELPREVLIATLQSHQRYFPVSDKHGELLPRFIAVSNLESPSPDLIRAGNERVVRPRLADARFFWESDTRLRLADRLEDLKHVVFERRLGSMYDKTQRTVVLAAEIAEEAGASAVEAERAALLAKCDLLTAMVGEFPELQGTMGRYYASRDGEPETVARAIEEHYLPRFAGDRLPADNVARALAAADKLDTICGIFATGQRPSGNRDPFGLRRAALGLLRISIEGSLDLPLPQLIQSGLRLQPVAERPKTLAHEVYDYIFERLRAYYAESREGGANPEWFDAVAAVRPGSPLDFHQRMTAVGTFMGLSAAASLAAANKRVANLLRKSAPAGAAPETVEALLEAPQEIALYHGLNEAEQAVSTLLEERAYTRVLERLAELRGLVDAFFDHVMVMAEDTALRENRLALLSRMRRLFLNVADLSLLGT